MNNISGNVKNWIQTEKSNIVTEQSSEVLSKEEILKNQHEIAENLMCALNKSQEFYSKSPDKTVYDLIISIDLAISTLNKIN